jgi:hypothetical protein
MRKYAKIESSEEPMMEKVTTKANFSALIEAI